MPTIYYEPSVCNCDGVDYSKADIENAASLALELAKKGRTIGNDKYPHIHNNRDRFDFPHASLPYLEFPLLQKGKTYDGRSPGAERVVIGSVADDFGSAVYCACVTRSGEGEEDQGGVVFAACKDDSVNPRGKGMLPTEGKGLVGGIGG
ncbi:hypothetical protein SLS58_011028 [Diplodia intermedia]|uniref:ribonuclease T1 n=1 Tax=Diplodia intermedia TaxID=856260 RepID=A0ABR3T1Y8_9PEZI